MCDINIEKKDGYAEVTGVSEVGKRFLKMRYDEDKVKVEYTTLEIFIEYAVRIGIACRMLML